MVIIFTVFRAGRIDVEAAKADGSRRYLLDEQQVENYKERFVSVGMFRIIVRARERERERENISSEEE